MIDLEMIYSATAGKLNKFRNGFTGFIAFQKDTICLLNYPGIDGTSTIFADAVATQKGQLVYLQKGDRLIIDTSIQSILTQFDSDLVVEHADQSTRIISTRSIAWSKKPDFTDPRAIRRPRE
jgi:hypothetical protein